MKKAVYQTATFDLPPLAPWNGKSRPAVLVKCADDLSEAFDKIKNLCLGLHVAKVNNDVIAFVFKTYESAMDLPTGYVIHKPSTARFPLQL